MEEEEGEGALKSIPSSSSVYDLLTLTSLLSSHLLTRTEGEELRPVTFCPDRWARCRLCGKEEEEEVIEVEEEEEDVAHCRLPADCDTCTPAGGGACPKDLA